MPNAVATLNVVIVNYCTPDLVIRCVDSIVAQGIAPMNKIVVVDNRSPDDLYTKLKESLVGANVLSSNKNEGYGAGVNFGALRCTEDLLLILNPDTYFEDNSIHNAIKILMSDSEAAVLGLDLVYPNGDRQFSSRGFYSCVEIVARRTPLGRHWPLKGRVDSHLMKTAWDADRPFEADWVMGTGFVVRRDVFNLIGGMDEAYFMYMEDVDFCARVWQAGFKVLCVPNARLVHDHQRSSVRPFSRAGRSHLRSLVRFHNQFGVPLFVAPSHGQGSFAASVSDDPRPLLETRPSFRHR